ncbi:MAG: tetratricopeptide repeat protein [Crocinitomicaceae bacterium]|jgi:tetratricopeptide (TPR) repeat protein|nr:tetratricopeptide repeat protein [Crocinitomicaceae bacterium]
MFENLTGDNLKQEFKENKNVRLATYAIGGILVLAIGYFAYNTFIWGPDNEKSKEVGFAGLNYADKDSTDLAIQELEPVVSKFDGKDGGEVAQFVLGRQYMEKGEFEKALSTLEGVDVNDTYVNVMSIGLQGDCLSELKKYDEAVRRYMEAAQVEKNDYTTPMYLFKAALLLEQKLNNPEKATEVYTEIKDNYLSFSNQKSIDRYIERAKNKKSK